MKKLILLSVLLTIIIFVSSSENDDSTSVNINDFLIISHRGVPSEARDHTFEGYDLAIEQGSNYIEQDLFLSADGYIIVSHDNEILNGMKITDMTLKEVKKIEKENGEFYLTLEEVFDQYGNTVNYVIENKFTDNSFILEQKILTAIEEHDLENNVILQSFHADSLRFYYKKDIDIPLMLLINDRNNSDALTNFDDYYFADIFTFHSILLDESSIVKLQNSDITTFVYFINETEEERQRVLELGIDGLFTDYTKKTFEMLADIN